MDRVAITKDNATPLVEVLTWFCLIVSILAVIARLSTKGYLLRRFDLDDYFISISLVFTSAQSIAIAIAASNGLGKRLDSLSVSQVSSLLKSQYASTFLFIASVYFAKLSLITYLRGLSLSKIDRRSSLVAGWAVTLWATIAILTTAFQCHLPQTWDYIHGACFNRTSWANFVAIVNGLTDVALIILPSMIILRLKVAPTKKAILLIFFMARLSVIAAIILQITYLNRTSHSRDPTLSTWPVTLCTQIVQSLSILTTCIVYLRPFLDSLQTGFIQVDDLRRQHLPGFGYSPERQDRKDAKSAWSVRNLWSRGSKTESQQSADVELQRNTKAGLQRLGNEADAGAGRCNEWDMGEGEGGDAHSRSRIVLTTTLTVREEDCGNGR